MANGGVLLERDQLVGEWLRVCEVSTVKAHEPLLRVAMAYPLAGPLASQVPILGWAEMSCHGRRLLEGCPALVWGKRVGCRRRDQTCETWVVRGPARPCAASFGS